MNVDYNFLSIKKLKNLAKQNKIKRYSSLRKKQLIESLIEYYKDQLFKININDFDENHVIELLKYANLYDKSKDITSILNEIHSNKQTDKYKKQFDAYFSGNKLDYYCNKRF